MDRSIPLLLIGLVFGGCIGFAVAASNGITLDRHNHADHGGHAVSEGHDHGAMLDLPANATAPTLDLHVTPDPSAGWNLHIVTENFVFSPWNASLAHVPGEGHAHVFVDGVKAGRFYGPWVHLDNLPSGEVTVEVTLNANDHRVLGVNGRPLSKTATIGN